MLTEDLDTFFDVDEFAQTVSLDGVSISGIFDERPVEIDFNQTLRPFVTCKASDASTASYNSTVVIGSNTYKVKRIENDDTARITTMQLEKQ